MREMKDSGIEWIGKIPADWGIKRLRYLCSISTGNGDTQDAIPEGIYPFYVRSPIVQKSNSYTFCGESILMAGDGVGAGRVFHHAFGKYAVHQRVYILYDFKDVSADFLFYYIRVGFPNIMDQGSAQSTVPSVRLPMLLNFPVISFLIAEQQKIADFLDAKCGEIDGILGDIEAQTETLEAYKRSVITEAVTKGLHPDSKMKDSGVEWIGEIPADWSVKKIKYVAEENFESGLMRSDVEQYLGLENVLSYSNEIYETKTEYETAIQKKCHRGNVLFAKLRPYLAKVIISPFDGFCTSEFLELSNYQGDNRFLRYSLLNPEFIKTVNQSTYGAKMPRANSEFIMNLKIVFPSKEEQQEIADFLDAKCGEIDALIAGKKEQAETLRAYKKSLIFEYVTGKKEVPRYE